MFLGTTDMKCWQFISCLLLCVGVKAPGHYNSIVIVCQCHISSTSVAWKQMTVNSNRLLLVLSSLYQTQINSIAAAKYGIVTVQPLVNVSGTNIYFSLLYDVF